MNSKTLKENGFADFSALKQLSISNLPSNDGQVFVLIDNTLSEKLASDVLYIGRAKKPIKKIFGGYIGGFGGKTAKKIHNALFKDGYLEKTSISWMASEDPKATQKDLLEKFKNEHGGNPPWNSPAKEPNVAKPRAKSAKPAATRKPASPKAQKPQ
jgi:hypothetical protein